MSPTPSQPTVNEPRGSAPTSTGEILRSAHSEMERRILLALIAFAAGDAFGVAYEYLPAPIPVDPTTISARAGWPRGGVSDDTSLSLLTIRSLIPEAPERSADRFLSLTRAALPGLRGLGPTTRAALGLEPPADEGLVVVGRTIIGDTNGGMMRTALLGLGYPPAKAEQRREMVAALAGATHSAPTAIAAAVLCSALYSDALTAAGPDLAANLRAELQHLRDVPPAALRWMDALVDWTPPGEGISLDPFETLAAVVWVADRSRTPLDAFRSACEIGGDTDTVAALAGGLISARSGSGDILTVPWIDEVGWSEIPDLAPAAARLADLRDAA